MDRTALRQTLRQMLEEEVGEEFDDLPDDRNLREGLGLDSVDLVSLVIHIQRRFQIDIPTEELEKLVKVGDLLDLLQAKIAARSAA
ncbi:MAG TPA: acyl carrier protein [Gemmataceae bacterium]|nr:acyl carrier protein [Gemmataceae bacterium]